MPPVPRETPVRAVSRSRLAIQDATGLDAAVTLVGRQSDPAAAWTRSFLAANLIRFHWIDVRRHPVARYLLKGVDLGAADLPVCIGPGERVVHIPRNAESNAAFRAKFARTLKLHTRPRRRTYDVAIVGAGPAGLAAAVYAASEGLRTVVLESDAPGGQAGSSARLENCLGFPDGVTGDGLARLAQDQARKFGAEVVVTAKVSRIAPARTGSRRSQRLVVELVDGSTVKSAAVIAATGVAYRELSSKGLPRLLGRGVYYGGAKTEATVYRGSPVVVIGGGNSAGQAAEHLAEHAKFVTVVVRRTLREKMAHFLIERLDALPNVEVIEEARVAAVEGGHRLERVVVCPNRGADTRVLPARAMFVYIGTKPWTDWSKGLVLRDDKEYIVSGPALGTYPGRWPLERAPYSLETSVPRLLAAGDVRFGAMPRVSCAVGEGALAVQIVHELLKPSKPALRDGLRM